MIISTLNILDNERTVIEVIDLRTWIGVISGYWH